MLQPNELKTESPVALSGGVMTTTVKVWEILLASRQGDLEKVKSLASECPELIYAQYNYAAPIHFAVREGHVTLVKFLLDSGAYDPSYRTYPFLDSLPLMATDRGYSAIVALLQDYEQHKERHRYKGDCGSIVFNRTEKEKEFETAVDRNDIEDVKRILQQHREFAVDETFFWGEGILAMPAKEDHREMMELLFQHGAKVPAIVKWGQAYYFKHQEAAAWLLENCMSAQTMSWQRVTLLHDMAQKGYRDKATLLVRFGADLNAIDEEYRSTPLGMACRWGQKEMVAFLLQQGADPNKAGAPWATPLSWAQKKSQYTIVEMLLEAGAT